ncbi:MAG TPA: HYR domain-containing protein [Bacteroidetes bacterium]|nr:HYR domain-containing protein [Bacteroidota bacterium]
MKKLLLILITVLTIGLHRAVSQVNLSVEDVEICDVNTVTVDFSINDLNGIGLLGYTATWDPAVLTFVNISSNNLPPLFAPNSTVPGQFTFSWFDQSAPFGDETLPGTVMFSIEFQVTGTYGTSSLVEIDQSTLTIGDGAGNPINNFTIDQGSVTIVDNTPPTLTCPADVMITVPFGTIDTMINNIGLLAFGDNCAVDEVAFALTGATTGNGLNNASSSSSGISFKPGMTTVTYTVTDDAGNSSPCQFEVNVEIEMFNPTDPRFYLTIDTLNCGDMTASISLGVINFNDVASFQFPIGWNTSEVTFNNLTINNLVTAANINQADAPNGELRLNWFNVTAVPLPDSTKLITIDFDLNSPATGSTQYEIDFTGFSGFPTGVFDAMGNPLAQLFQPGQILGLDEDAPVPDVATLPTIMEECSATVTAVPTATDFCEGAIMGTTGDPLTYTTQGTHIITWSYDDGNGNISTQTQTVVIDDVTDPVPDVANLPDIIVECSVMVTGVPTATDNCKGPINGTTADPLNYNTQGTFIITWTYDDGNGNSVTQTQNVIVDDVTAPVPDVMNLPDVTGECSATITVNPTATDNCEGTLTGTTPDPLAYNTQGTHVVTWTYDDGNGNTVTQTQNVVVDDVTAPVPDVATLPDVTGECVATVTSVPTATDNCEGVIMGTTTDPLTYSTQGTHTITWNFDDGNGNVSMQTQDVVIDDVTNPVAMCQDITVQLSASGQASIVAADVDNGSSDNCSVTLSIDNGSFDCTNLGANTVTLTATDPGMNTVDCTATVTVEDNIPPVAMCQDITIQLSASGQASIVAGDIDNGSSDNCSVTLSIDNGSFDCTNLGANTVALTVTDPVMATDDCTSTVTVEDNIPPVAMCQDITVQLSASGQASIVAGDVDNGSSDNCSVSLSIDNGSFDCTNLGANTVTLTATDPGTNTDDCTATVTVEDNILPTLSCPANVSILVPAGTMDTMIANIALVSSNDNCGIDTTYYHITGALTMEGDGGDASGTSFPVDTSTVTYYVEDAAGNIDSCSFEVVITEDNVLTIICPMDYNVSTDPDSCNAEVNTDGPVIAPIADLQELFYSMSAPTMGSGTDTLPDDQVFNVGTTTVTYTAVSISDDTVTCAFDVVVADMQVPVANCFADTIVYLDGTGSATIDLSYVDNGSTDNCMFTLAIDNSSFDCSDIGVNMVTLTATDASNGASCVTNVTVLDTIPPMLTSCPSSGTILYADMDCQATLPDYRGLVSFTDNCTHPDSLKVTQVPPNGTVIMADTTVAIIALDSVGNVSDTCFFLVTMADTFPPAITCPTPISVDATPDSCNALVTFDVTATDNCDSVVIVSTPPSGTFFPVGMTTVVSIATDVGGLADTCEFTVTVADTQDPVITDCPMMPDTIGNTLDSCGAIFNGDLLVNATDNCPGVVLSYSFTIGDLLPLGSNIIVATATDQSNNTATCTYELFVRDTQPPDIAPCPAEIVVNNDPGLCGAVVDWTPPTAEDNCGVLFIEATPYEPGDFIPVGTEFITYTASDFTGNITECIFSVKVTDNEPPTLAPCPGNMTVGNDPGLCSAAVTWPFISPMDNCGVVSFITLPQSGSTFPLGDTQVQAVATDAAGNVTVCSFTVTVEDVEFPTISNLPQNIVMDTDPGECGAVVTWGAITFGDNCGVDTSYCDAESGDFFGTGMHTVTCTVVDENNNSQTADFNITIEDKELPEVDCPSNINIVMDGGLIDDPSGFIGGLQSVACDSVALSFNGISATDNCGIASVQQTGGLVSGSTFGAGLHTLTYLVSDPSNNQATCSFIIEIEALPNATASAFPANPCEGDDVTFFTDDVLGASYIWTDPAGDTISTDATFTLSGIPMDGAGTYSVEINYPFNCTMTASVGVQLFPKPQIVINHNDLICTNGNVSLILEAVDTANTDVTQCVWEFPDGTFAFGETLTIINANSSHSGVYTVTCTTSNGCTGVASKNVIINDEPPKPDLTANTTEACVGEQIMFDGEEFSGPDITYHWTAMPDAASAGINNVNNHDNIANPTVPGTYTYQYFVTQGVCVSDTAEWIVVVEETPSLSLTTDGAVMCVDGSTDMVITALTGGAATWEISGGCTASQMDSVFTLSNVSSACSGEYTVTASSPIGCSVSETVTFDFTDKPETPVLQATDTVVCMGGSTTLFSSIPQGATTICYKNGQQVPCTFPGSIQPDADATYGIQVEIDGCVSDIGEVAITVEEPLSVDINVAGSVECVDGTSAVVLSTNAAGNTYIWSGPCGTQTGETLTIDNINAACSGLYSVSITGALEQCISIGTIQLEVTDALSDITAVQNGPACEDDDLSLCAEPAMTGAGYEWKDPSGNIFSNDRCPVVPAILEGSYMVTANLNGCTSSDAVDVNIIESPIANDEVVVGIVNTPQSFNVVVNDVLENDDYDITVIQKPSNGSVSYNGDGVFTYTPNRDFRENDVMAYQICYKDCPNACDVALVSIQVRFPGDQCIATTLITPNEDGINDQFVVSCLEVGQCPDNQLIIFNEWGDKVFEAAPYDNSWKGTYNGRDLPDGTYFYIFQCDTKQEAEKGFVMIYR